MTDHKNLPTPIAGAWNWRRAVISSELPPTTKHVLLTLACHASEAGEGAFPFLTTLAKETSLNKQTVRRHLKEAAALGWIVKEERFRESGIQTSNLYQLTAPGEGVSKVQGGTEDIGGGGTEDIPPGGTEDIPHTVKGPVKGQGNGGAQRELLEVEPPKAKQKGNGTKAFSLPTDWTPTDSHRERAKGLGLDVAEEAELFRLNAEARGKRYEKWNSAFTTWLIHGKRYKAEREQRNGGNGHGDDWAETYKPDWMGADA